MPQQSGRIVPEGRRFWPCFFRRLIAQQGKTCDSAVEVPHVTLAPPIHELQLTPDCRSCWTGVNPGRREKYQKALEFRHEPTEYQSALAMNGPERLAGPNLVQQIKQACLDDDVHLSRKTDDFLGRRDIPRDVVIAAVIRHIDEGRKLHVKIIPGQQACQGSLRLDPEDADTLYFEARIQKGSIQMRFSAVWMQVHEHDTGYPPLPR